MKLDSREKPAPRHWRRVALRVLAMTAFLAVSSLVVAASAAPRVVDPVGNAAFSVRPPASHPFLRSPLLGQACGAMVLPKMGEALACQRHVHSVYYARFHAPAQGRFAALHPRRLFP
jgi:hypothetical protein